MKTFPSEILALVLQDVCKLDDDEFEFAHRFNSKPPISTTRTAALLVCRRWNCVARSPIYFTIILSTVTQARCLGRTLSDQPYLGNYIRKLLFNGGFGATAHRILQATPHITHLCLSLAIRSSDSTRGLCKAIQYIQPRSVRLNDSNNVHNNTHSRALVAAICSCMKENGSGSLSFGFPTIFFGLGGRGATISIISSRQCTTPRSLTLCTCLLHIVRRSPSTSHQIKPVCDL
ncbi:uncharacterized protein EI90DRAFT_968466 [Cantharellus anzutake]|uniref:uncharacterized protein n=1 Tax=Cantharellus anzutake TaxID=1750568 RepID=UPI001908314E|nr:uncharacterized protein EI90DRAFT_968466 [Cantharellus anzutake]KAF8311429.1 hypothetical protein EI90DRAFT_968466 [Cantharellus anzutake]